MKSTISLFFILFIGSIACAQPKHSIKFIHIGTENKPIGTVIISVEFIFPLNKNDIDEKFGKSIKTDMRSFKILEKLLKNEEYKTLNPTGQQKESYISVWDSKGFGIDLFYPKSIDFFNDVRGAIIKKNADRAIIEALNIR